MTELKKQKGIGFLKKNRNGILIYPYTDNIESFLKAHYSYIKQTLKKKNGNSVFNYSMYKEALNLHKANLLEKYYTISLIEYLYKDFEDVMCNLFLLEKYKTESYYAYGTPVEIPKPLDKVLLFMGY